MPRQGASAPRSAQRADRDPPAGPVYRSGGRAVAARGAELFELEGLDDAYPVRAARGAGVEGRRTVTIRGTGGDRYAPTRAGRDRRRPERRYERTGFRPDRAAMWAVLLGILLIVVAATSAHAATLHAVAVLH
jgi:hypothetical protein